MSLVRPSTLVVCECVAYGVRAFSRRSHASVSRLRRKASLPASALLRLAPPYRMSALPPLRQESELCSRSRGSVPAPRGKERERYERYQNG